MAYESHNICAEKMMVITTSKATLTSDNRWFLTSTLLK